MYRWWTIKEIRYPAGKSSYPASYQADVKNFGRLVELHRLLLFRKGPVDVAEMRDRLECSRATVMRLLNELRNVTQDPIPYDRDRRGYRYSDPERQRSGLPSIWFNPPELYALLVIRHQLQQMQPGFLAEALAPLEQRLSELLSYEGIPAHEIARHICLISHSRRTLAPKTCFPECAEAVLQHKRLAIRYRSRSADETTDREISPYRLVAYRDNWYLDAWCHARGGLRRFAVDRLEAARVLDVESKPQSQTQLEANFAGGYGIFSGPATAEAVLRFTPECARWVADEIWHPQQQSRVLPDGRYELRIPYGDPTELIMEILKHGPDVEVLAPEELKQRVTARLAASLRTYCTSEDVYRIDHT